MSVNLLLSYAFHFSTDMADVRKRMPCGYIMVDSGAFTAHSTGKPIKLADYAAYLKQWRGCWDHAVTLDVIGNPQATRANTMKLHEQGLPVMPVFTRGNTLAEFDAMIQDVPYVCVGGGVGLPIDVQAKRAAMLQRRAAEYGGGIHALGIGTLTSLRKIKPYSADASNISGAFKFGNVVYFDGNLVRSIQLSRRDRIKRDWQHIRAHGIDLHQLATDGRLPAGKQRSALVQAMSVAFAAADEYLKHHYPVDPPTGHGGDGPHLYNSVIGKQTKNEDFNDVLHAADLDRRLHPGPHLYTSTSAQFAVQPTAEVDRTIHHNPEDVPPIWRTYGQTHTCNPEVAARV